MTELGQCLTQKWVTMILSQGLLCGVVQTQTSRGHVLVRGRADGHVSKPQSSSQALGCKQLEAPSVELFKSVIVKTGSTN